MIVTKHEISSACRCHGCKRLSKFVKGDGDAAIAFATTKGWTERIELRYGPSGRHRRRGGFVVNYYCRKCTKKGVNAAQVAEKIRASNKPFQPGNRTREAS